MLKRLVLIPMILGIMACTGGGGGKTTTTTVTPPPPPPPATTVGYFRTLKVTQPTQDMLASAPSNNGTVDMHYAREYHTARTMSSGDIVIAGGYSRGLDGSMIPSLGIEIFSLETERFYDTGCSLPAFPDTHYILPGIINIPGGKTVIFGGNPDTGLSIFTQGRNGNPDTLTYHDIVDADGNRPGMLINQIAFACTLPGSRILSVSTNRDIVIIDMNTLKFQLLVAGPKNELGHPNLYHATTVKLGDVLYIFGGISLDSVFRKQIDKFDITTGVLTENIAQMNLPRMDCAAARLQDGRIGIYGGRVRVSSDDATDFTKVVEIFDPVTNTCAEVGSLLKTAAGNKALQLANGFVVYLGGWADGYPTKQELFYDHRSNTSGFTGLMTSARSSHTITPLLNGRVLVAGGSTDLQPVGEGHYKVLTSKTAEIYEPESKLYVVMPTDTIEYGTSLQMTVEYVTPDVTWELINNENGVMSEGIIDQTGLYVAPTNPTMPTATVKVTSKSDPKVFAVVIINLIAPVPVG